MIMNCTNCSIGKFVPLPHTKYMLVELNITTKLPTNGGVPIDGQMCNKCGFIRIFHKFKPQT